MPTYIQKICEHCSREFSVLPRYKKKRFCGRTCFTTHTSLKSKPKFTTCQSCHTVLTHPTTHKFCSKSCAATFNNALRSQESRMKQRCTLRENSLAKKDLSSISAQDHYYALCKFTFLPYEESKVPNYELLVNHSIYHPLRNTNGVVRDHIISKKYGYQNNIDPKIISHPANCQWLAHRLNCSKGADSWLTIDQLISRIESWSQNNINHSVILKAKNASKKTNPIYKWTLVHNQTMEEEETTNITSWLKIKGLGTGGIYGSNPLWKIKEKYNLKSGARVI